MLTDLQQQSLTAALELGSRVPEIGTGGWAYGRFRVNDPEVWHRINLHSPVDFTKTIHHATQEHYDAACWRLARWLIDEHGWVTYRSKIADLWCFFHLDGESIKLDCPDDELSALVAACKEVGK